MKDVLSRRGVFRALVEMRRIDPEPMTAGMLQKAVGMAVETAVDLRRDLEAWGLITVTEGVRNKALFIDMRLTPEGRAAADHALKVEAEALKGKARQEKGA